MKRIFAVKHFMKWAKKHEVSMDILLLAVEELVDGQYEAKLNACLFKKRIAFKGRGKRGSARTLIAYSDGQHVFFLYGFAKNERDNITPKEKIALTEYGRMYLSLSTQKLNEAIELGELIEVGHYE